jgi:hypothetical protein
MDLNFSELAKISYLKIQPGDDRVVPLQPCYLENGEWESWIPINDQLLRLRMVDSAEQLYFGKQPAREGDGYSEFFNLILKRALWKDVSRYAFDILDDVYNLSSSIEKIDLFHKLWLNKNESIQSQFISTELEFIFITCRSLYDLLQKIAKSICSRVAYLDGSRPKPLRESFAEMALKGGELKSPEQIASKYGIHEPLAQFYNRQGDFFIWLRSYRDRINHHGAGFAQVFITERGFAVSTNQKPFSRVDIWNESNTQGNDLGSVRTVLSYVMTNTLLAIEDFARIIGLTIELPYDVAPDHYVFMRGYHVNRLLELGSYLHDHPWSESEISE